jgi:hypothetical protein
MVIRPDSTAKRWNEHLMQCPGEADLMYADTLRYVNVYAYEQAGQRRLHFERDVGGSFSFGPQNKRSTIVWPISPLESWTYRKE